MVSGRGCCSSSGRPAEAEAAARDGLAADPENWWLHGLLSMAHYRQRRPRAALAAADAAVALAPDEPWGHELRAFALHGIGRRRSALAAAREAVRLDPGSAQAWDLLSWTELNVLHPRRARAAAKRALELDPSAATGHYALARVAVHWGAPNEAERHARAILAGDPTDADAANLLGATLQRRFKHRAAVVAYVKALELDPVHETATRNLRLALQGAVETAAVGTMFLAVFAAGLLGLTLQGGPVLGPIAGAWLLGVLVAIVALWVLAARLRAVVPPRCAASCAARTRRGGAGRPRSWAPALRSPASSWPSRRPSRTSRSWPSPCSPPWPCQAPWSPRSPGAA